MKINVELNMHNKFELELRHADGTITKAFAYNVVLDVYYDYLKNGNLSGSNLYAPSLDQVFLGSGTGTPSASDQALFSQVAYKTGTVGSLTKTGSNSYSKTVSVVFGNNEANADLTEIGIGGSNRIFTHAMLTDAEGHTITIHKEMSDILTVVATVYLTLPSSSNWPSWITPFPFSTYRLPSGIEADNQPVGTELVRDNVSEVYTPQIPPLIYFCLGYNTIIPTYSYRPIFSSDGYYYYSNSLVFTTRYARQQDGTGLVSTVGTINSTQWNADVTYQIRALGSILGIITFPNHDIFPPKEIELTATGDGVTTDFNFGIPELMTGSTNVEVKVNGATLNYGTQYTWGGKDFRLRQAWCSQHGTYMVARSGDVPIAYSGSSQKDYSPTINYHPVHSNSLETEYTLPLEYIYDFGQSGKKVNAFCSEVTKVFSSHSSASCILSYANSLHDTSNYFAPENIGDWAEAARIETSSSISVLPTNPNQISETTARYWKLTFSDPVRLNYAYDNGLLTHCVGGFDFVQPQLHFATPPGNGDVISVKAKTEYPIKNSNWLISEYRLDFEINPAS